MVNKVMRFGIVCMYLNSGKNQQYIFGEKNNNPCSLDGTANMAAPYCIHLDIFFNLTSILGVLF